jgi:3-dehydroquinate synthase
LLPDSVHIEAQALDRLGDVVAGLAVARCVIIADSNVAGMYGQAALGSVQAAGLPADLVAFPAGEASKTRETWAALADRAAELGLGRDGCVVAVGGGVTLDLAGFVAATYMRGVALVLVPTSLLGMVDAAWGGKTGVDTVAGKNLAGALHRPRAVLVDPAVLATLPDAELRHGLAEAVKHGAIRDREQLAWIERRRGALLGREEAALLELVTRSAACKRAIVAADPYERGERALLNFGHTVGHALERLTGYRLPHGAAVAIGMVAEAAIGEAAAVTEAGTAAELARVLTGLGLPVAPPAWVTAVDVLPGAGSDKKARGGRIRYALIERIGVPAGSGTGWTVEVPEEVARHSLARLWAGAAGARQVSPERNVI